MNWRPHYSLIAGVGLIVVVNAFVLGGAAYNRSHEPESALRLSERELRAPMGVYRDKEDSGIALRLKWRVLPPDLNHPKQSAKTYRGYFGNSPEWLDPSKMLALGFEAATIGQSPDGPPRSRQPLPRDVLLVLELDGAAYQAALARAVRFSEAASAQSAERASEELKRERDEDSRLFVVDAGLDVAALRARYPDRSRYAIVHGQVRPNQSIKQDSAAPAGSISGVSAERLNVPLDWRHVFDGASADPRDGQAPLRYTVDVKFGQRLEPWVGQATRVSHSASP